MSFISLFLQDIVDKKLDYVELKIFEQILPSNLSATSKEHIAILLKNDPKISSKIDSLKTKIYDQIQLGTVMFVNALIGLVPVPIIPGLIRTSNNAIFQMLKTGDRILEFREIINTSLELLDYDPTIRSFLENKGIPMEKVSSNTDNNVIMENVAKSAKKAFNKIDEEYLQDGKLTPLQIYDRINTLAGERDTQQNTRKPLALPPPKSSKITQKAGRKIKNKKQKKHYKKRTKRIKHKK